MRNVGFGIIASIVAVTMLWSCSIESSIFGGKMRSGSVNFAVSFPYMEEGNSMVSIMPQEMVMKFQDGKYKTEFSTYGGVFRSNVLVDTEKKEYKQMLKVFRKKLACKFDAVDMDELMMEFPPFSIIPSNKLDTIAGVPCKTAIGVFHDVGADNIDIYYTDEIQLDKPNWCTPFAEIDGVLMGYDVDMFDIRMRLLATEVSTGGFDEKEFAIDKDYKMVSYKYIRTEIEKLMSSFDI